MDLPDIWILPFNSHHRLPYNHRLYTYNHLAVRHIIWFVGLIHNMNVHSQTQDWVPQIEGASGPIYLAIADAIGAAVSAGTLSAGDRLPTHRALADSLDVDLTTITRAYAEAQKRGLLQARVGRGTFVRSDRSTAPIKASPSDGPVDLGMNLPPIPTHPPLSALLQQGLSRLLAETDPTLLLAYRTGCGSADERAAGAAWLRPTLGEVDPERILVCPGAQLALFSALGMVAASGDVVLTDALTYPGIRGAAAQLGIRLAGVHGDASGLLPDALDEACHTLRPKALYCIPTIQNPTTVTMPLERRRTVADVARRHGLPILEDDAYGLLPTAALPAIAALAPEITFHLATVSKTLSPALRVAWLVAPDARHAARLCAALRRSVLMGSPLLTGLLANWVHDGTANAILAAVRRESAARQRLARAILPAGSFDAHPEGLHIWLRLPPRWDRRDLVAHLRQQGRLAVVPSDAFAADSADVLPDAVRVSLGAAADREALRGALHTIASALDPDAPVPFADVI
jgi:DNA-binding transcriptional MocR family regulator